MYAENTGESISPAEVAVAWGLVITFTAVMILLLRVFIKDGAQLALVTAIVLVIFFSYGEVHNLFAGNPVGEDRFLLPIFGLVGLASAGFVVRSRFNWRILAQAAAIMASFLVVFNLVRIGIELPGNSGVKAGEFGSALAGKTESKFGYLPDIYYIILDAYGRADALEDIYGFDNSEFIGFLTDRGFYVAPESRTNYIHTQFSLGSSLNLRYLTPKENGVSLIKNNSLVPLAQGLGYQYHHISSGRWWTKTNKFADVVTRDRSPARLVLSDFTGALLPHTIALGVARTAGVNLVDPFLGSHASNFETSMEALRDIPAAEGPTFTFSHNIPPHDPFVFDRDGNLRTGYGTSSTDEFKEVSELYIDQLVYVNKTVQETIEFILKNSDRKPVIIIQGDHGPNYSVSSSYVNPSDDLIRERTGILNAYYFPEPCDSSLYPSISPVNSFRLVFACLGLDLPLLEDNTIWSVTGDTFESTPIQQR